VITAQKEAEKHGTMHSGGKPSTRDMFEGVYAKCRRTCAASARRRGSEPWRA
jgi:hypothetical protein